MKTHIETKIREINQENTRLKQELESLREQQKAIIDSVNTLASFKITHAHTLGFAVDKVFKEIDEITGYTQTKESQRDTQGMKHETK